MSQLTRIGLAAALFLGALPMAHADGESSCTANGTQKVAAIEIALSAALPRRGRRTRPRSTGP